MAAIGVGPQGVTPISPPARLVQEKLGVITVADGATGFQAFGIPKNAVICGVYTIVQGANATQTVSAGFTSGGAEVLNAFAPNSTGYAPAGAAIGSAVGVQQTADRVIWLKASVTLTTPVIVKVEYYVPPSGLPL